MKKAQQHAGVSTEQIKNFAKREGIDSKLIDAFIKFDLSINGQEIMDKTGMKAGPELGKEIQRLETQNFKNLL